MAFGIVAGNRMVVSSVRDGLAGCDTHAAVLLLVSTSICVVVPTSKCPSGNDGRTAATPDPALPAPTIDPTSAPAKTLAMIPRSMSRGYLCDFGDKGPIDGFTCI